MLRRRNKRRIVGMVLTVLGIIGVGGVVFQDGPGSVPHTVTAMMRKAFFSVSDPPAKPSPHGGGDRVASKAPPKSVRSFTAVIQGTNPLTGIPTIVSQFPRPLVVMIENSPRARPQAGLVDADLVYEVLAEGNITRFVTVFQSTVPEKIGPVRSIRPYLVELGAGVDGLIVHAGWSQDAMIWIERNQIDHLDQVYGDHVYYWRDRSRRAPHNLYTSGTRLHSAFEKKELRTQWRRNALAFARKSPLARQGVSTTEVTIPYPSRYIVGYRYDELLHTYVRWMNQKEHRDEPSDRLITAKNVLIVEADHQILDSVGRRAVDLHTGGKGYLLQAGKRYDVYWRFERGIIRPYATADAPKPVPLLPGTTWVQIVEKLSRVSYHGTQDDMPPHGLPLGQ